MRSQLYWSGDIVIVSESNLHDYKDKDPEFLY